MKKTYLIIGLMAISNAEHPNGHGKKSYNHGRHHLIDIQNNPGWASVTSSGFALIAICDHLIREYHLEHSHKPAKTLRKSFYIMKAANTNLPYATEGMIDIYNKHKSNLFEQFYGALRLIGSEIAESLNKDDSIASEYYHNKLSNSLKQLNQAIPSNLLQDYGTIMSVQHTKPARRSFGMIKTMHGTLLSSIPESFDISSNHKIWRILPTHYNPLIAGLFLASNKSDRNENIAKHLCTIAFYLELLASIMCNRQVKTTESERNLVRDGFVEFQKSLLALIDELVKGKDREVFTALINKTHSFDPIKAIIKLGCK